MLLIATASLISLLATAALLLAGLGNPLAVAHLAFAVGILPLIFAAMMHFVPVLTRSRDPHRLIAKLPIAAQGAGLFIVAAMQGLLPYATLYTAAGIDLILALTLLAWIVGRARKTLGRPHPGWRWYGASIVCLMLALGAILLQAIFPDSWQALRLFHLHLNPLGFVGLAAFGTLPVLLPTALGKPDPEAAGWLTKRLPFTLAGALMVALGAAISKPWALAITAAGAAILLLVLISLFMQWLGHYGLQAILRQGAAASLLAAGIGALLVICLGPLHGSGVLPPRGALLGWAAGFLLPLVTGALSQLLPVWRWPGPDSLRRQAMRSALTRHGLPRGILFLLGATAFYLGQTPAGGLLIALGMLLFAANVVLSIRIAAVTR